LTKKDVFFSYTAELSENLKILLCKSCEIYAIMVKTDMRGT